MAEPYAVVRVRWLLSEEQYFALREMVGDKPLDQAALDLLNEAVEKQLARRRPLGHRTETLEQAQARPPMLGAEGTPTADLVRHHKGCGSIASQQPGRRKGEAGGQQEADPHQTQ